MNGSNQYGVIHEVGDMGIGFEPLSQKDNQTLNEQKTFENQSGNDDNGATERR